MTEERFIRTYPPASAPKGPAHWFLFQEGEMLAKLSAGRLNVLDEADAAQVAQDDENIFLGLLDGVPCIAGQVEQAVALPDSWTRLSLRTLFGRVEDAVYSIAGYASQMLYWKRTSRFCPVCGHAPVASDHDWGRRCPNCGHIAYPRINPAVLILVHDAGKILLAQKPGWGKRYSILAGFVEPGESLEDCVRRETFEEVGLQISDLSYAGSQTWPFPHQLMVGFEARLASGDITLDQLELENAVWFTPDALPELPPPVSLSRRMIDAWTARQPGSG